MNSWGTWIYLLDKFQGKHQIIGNYISSQHLQAVKRLKMYPFMFLELALCWIWPDFCKGFVSRIFAANYLVFNIKRSKVFDSVWKPWRCEARTIDFFDISTPSLEHMRDFGLSTLDHMLSASYCVMCVCC